MKLLHPNELLFDIGETCRDIFFVISGVVDIIITDNKGNTEVLDVLGRDSVIGGNFVLIKE